MSYDAKIGALVLFVFAAIVAGLILEGRHDAQAMRERCEQALRGATASDSLRIITVQPECGR